MKALLFLNRHTITAFFISWDSKQEDNFTEEITKTSHTDAKDVNGALQYIMWWDSIPASLPSMLEYVSDKL